MSCEHEHGCECCHHSHGWDKKELLWLCGGVLGLVLGILLPAPWHMVAFAAGYLVAGYEVLLSAGRNLLRGKVFDENFLMTLATVGAFAIGEYPEAVAVMLFYRVGEMFEHMAAEKSKHSITELLDLRPKHANLVCGINIKAVPPDEVSAGDVILIKAGERVPLDAKIIDGTSALDTAALTGESLPRDVKPGDLILSGCINLSGTLHARVVKSFEDSTVSEILRVMESAGEKKARLENFITRFARVYTPIVVGVAPVLALVPPLVFRADWSSWIYRALVFLMVSCPCALVLSIPLGYFCGLGSASKNGILVKGGCFLDALARADTVVFDKTGTLTEGSFTVREIHANGMSETALLTVAAYIECSSNHPIAKSICAAYGGEFDRGRIGAVREIPGQGICAEIDGRTMYAGNLTLMRGNGIEADTVDAVGAVVHLAADTVYLGYLVVSDREKDGAREALEALKEQGVAKTVMLTGDRRSAAEQIAARLGLDEVVSELLPNEKVREVERLYGVCDGALVYVGDGINDAPAIARADVGVAMGAIGADAAIEAADVVVMTDEPRKIAEAVSIAKRTSKIVRQNTVLTLGVKAVVLVLGALGFAGMWQAVFADVGVALLAVLNATRAFETHGRKSDELQNR